MNGKVTKPKQEPGLVDAPPSDTYASPKGPGEGWGLIGEFASHLDTSHTTNSTREGAMLRNILLATLKPEFRTIGTRGTMIMVKCFQC